MLFMSGNFILTVCTAWVKTGILVVFSLFFSLPPYVNTVPFAHFGININCQNVNVSNLNKVSSLWSAASWWYYET